MLTHKSIEETLPKKENIRYSFIVEWFCQPDEKSFVSADVAEPIRVLVLNHFANELSAMLVEPGEHLVNVVNGEHDA